MKAFSFASLVLALAWMQPQRAFSKTIAGAVHGGDPVPKDTVLSYNICFPADFELRTCSIPPAPSILLDELGECDVLAVQIEESKYRVSGEECFKIFRTYTVMNWCAYTEACGSREDQVFVVDRDAPDFDVVFGEGVCVLVRDADKNGYPEVYYSNDLIADPGDSGLPFIVGAFREEDRLIAYFQRRAAGCLSVATLAGCYLLSVI